MEEFYEIIKQFIVNKLPEYLTQYATSDTPLPALTEGKVIFGPVDLTRYEYNQICSVVPMSQSNGESDLADYSVQSGFTIGFIVQGGTPELLVRQMCRYASAFRHAVIRNYTLDNDGIDDVSIDALRYNADAGTVEKQLAVAEIDITITTSAEIE